MPSNLLLDKADRFIQSAELLVKDGDFDSAVSRLYYALFHTAQALLETKSLSFSSHRAVISAYGQHFARTGELDPRFHKVLLNAFNQRQLGDYAVESGLQAKDVAELTQAAHEFLQLAKAWIENRTS